MRGKAKKKQGLKAIKARVSNEAKITTKAIVEQDTKERGGRGSRAIAGSRDQKRDTEKRGQDSRQQVCLSNLRGKRGPFSSHSGGGRKRKGRGNWSGGSKIQRDNQKRRGKVLAKRVFREANTSRNAAFPGLARYRDEYEPQKRPRGEEKGQLPFPKGSIQIACENGKSYDNFQDANVGESNVGGSEGISEKRPSRAVGVGRKWLATTGRRGGRHNAEKRGPSARGRCCSAVSKEKKRVGPLS